MEKFLKFIKKMLGFGGNQNERDTITLLNHDEAIEILKRKLNSGELLRVLKIAKVDNEHVDPELLNLPAGYSPQEENTRIEQTVRALEKQEHNDLSTLTEDPDCATEYRYGSFK